MSLMSGCVVQEKQNDEGSGIVVDTTLGEGAAKYPAFTPASGERREAVIVGPSGNRYRFIELELLVAAHNQAELDAMLERTGGTLLESWSFAQDGDETGFDYHAVKIDPSRIAREDLDAALAAIESAKGGIKVSSDDALMTLAAYASESKHGVVVFPNFIFEKQTIADRATSEAPSAVGFEGDYTPNTFDWPYMKRGGPLDIGVAEAWRVLEANDKISGRVPVMIMDAGFKQTGDLPADTILAGDTQWDEPNRAQCCEGTCDCEWHGTGTARTVAAQVDDDHGGAGSGGPVAQPVLLQSPVDDFFDYLRYIGGIGDGLSSARIVNISAGTTIDQWVCDTSGFFMGPAGVCAAPHALGASLRAAGYLVIASAGNDGNRDLDSGDFTLPCEMAGTMCVGGMSWNAPTRHPNSTRASRGATGAIDIWAPFDVWVGADPLSPSSNLNTVFSGTSASAPFVAGVAALIQAANPSYGPNQIENAIVSTAHVGTSGQVHRWLNAYAAVASAVGGKTPPFIRILQPSTGNSAPHIEASEMFNADVTDAGPDLVVTWSDDVDGPLGTGLTITHPGLSFGTHIVTATATSNGVSHSTSVTVERTNVPPTVQIITPGTGASFYQSQTISLLAQSNDPNEPEGKLAASQLTWFAGTTPLGSGYALDVPGNTLVPGTYVLELHGTDGVHGVDATRSITVLPNPVNLPPNIGVITPATGTDLGYADMDLGNGWYKAVTLSATALDPDGPTPPDSAFTWKTTYTNPSTGAVTTTALGTGKTLNTQLIGLCFAVQHQVTLTVTDGVNQSTKSVLLTVHLLC
jgi:subtilisin family serine protease